MSDKKEDIKDFIVARENQRPLIVSRDKLVVLVKALEIKGDDLIYCDKQKVWKKARNVKGLRSLISRLETRQDDESLVLGQEVEEEDDALDDVLFKENKEQISKEHKFIPLPDILIPKTLENSNTEIKKDTVLVLKSSVEKEEAWIKSIEKFSFKDSPFKTWLQYGLIFCFLIVLTFNFYPSSKKVEVNDYLHGKITLNGEQLKNLTIGLKGSGGEVYGFVASNGMYRVDNPPKGIIKIKLGALIPTQQNQTSGSFKKNEAKEKKKKSEVIYFKYETFENNFELEYPGGVKQFDIELKSD